jgi:hypothetical protein
MSSLTDGVRGLPPQDEEPEDYNLCGVDWEAMEGNRDAAEDENGHNHPEWVNNVVCEPPRCPLTDEQAVKLMVDLAAAVDVESKNMDGRRLVWVKALELFVQVVGDEENGLLQT